jgi:ketosteroid isomerase-like protein
MTGANIEIVRGIYASVDSPWDEVDIEAILEQHVDPQIVWEPIEAPDAYHGHEGVMQAFEQWFDAMEDFEVELEEVSGHGNSVLAVTHHRARGKGSGVEAGQRVFQVFTFRDGKILRFQEFADREGAEAVIGP